MRVIGPRWEDQQAMYIGLRYPEDRKKRKRRKHSRAKSADSGPPTDPSARQCRLPPAFETKLKLNSNKTEIKRLKRVSAVLAFLFQCFICNITEIKKIFQCSVAIVQAL